MLSQRQIYRFLSQESSATDTDTSTIAIPPDANFENKNRLMSVIGELVGHRGRVTALAARAKMAESSEQFLISSALDMVRIYLLIPMSCNHCCH